MENQELDKILEEKEEAVKIISEFINEKMNKTYNFFSQIKYVEQYATSQGIIKYLDEEACIELLQTNERLKNDMANCYNTYANTLNKDRSSIVKYGVLFENIYDAFEYLYAFGSIADYDDQSSEYGGLDPVRMYLAEIGRIPLYPASEELKVTQEYKKVCDELEKISSDSDEYKELDELKYELRKNIAEHNLRLVVNIAKHYVGRNLPLLDLIQSGNEGLLRAIDKFEPEKGYRFSTYATWWIRQSVTRALADQSRNIRIPVHMHEKINRMIRIERQLEAKLGHEPSINEIAAAMETEPELVLEYKRINLNQDPVSLELTIGEDDDSQLKDFVADDYEASPEEQAMQVMLREQIREVLQEERKGKELFSERERLILTLRFGLFDNGLHTLEEVGNKLGITRERVRQIEAKSLRKLRLPSCARKLRDFSEPTRTL